MSIYVHQCTSNSCICTFQLKLKSPQGIAYYRSLFEECEKYNIIPMVTLSHFDMPYILENDMGGWLNPESVEWFVQYARVCFDEFSHLVPFWLTFNEPMQTVTGGWENGNWPPGISSNKGRDVYMAGRHILLAHARVYRHNFWFSI